MTHLTRAQLAIVYNWADGVSTPRRQATGTSSRWPYVQQSVSAKCVSRGRLRCSTWRMHDAGVACWDAKYAYFNPRPSQLDPTIRTVIGLPNFPSYISGHSTFSAAASGVLSLHLPGRCGLLRRAEGGSGDLAVVWRYPLSRDIEVGKVVGVRVGDYTVRFALHDGADR